MTLFEEALMMLDEAKRRAVDIQNTDGAIVELVEQAIKRLQADHDALIAEHAEMEGLLVRATTESENQRIRNFQHQQRVRWVGRDGG